VLERLIERILLRSETTPFSRAANKSSTMNKASFSAMDGA
jgi:hypothetical protein